MKSEFELRFPGEKINVHISCDQNGIPVKNYIVEILASKRYRDKYTVTDLSPEAGVVVDYPLMVQAVVDNVLDGYDGENIGILACGTGSGVLIAANRYPGIRAILAEGKATSKLGREHNNANVLCLGTWRSPLDRIPGILKAFLKTEFGGGRHIPRVEMLSQLPGRIEPPSSKNKKEKKKK